jgi:hypothetical protein
MFFFRVDSYNFFLSRAKLNQIADQVGINDAFSVSSIIRIEIYVFWYFLISFACVAERNSNRFPVETHNLLMLGI